jgi:hypothetical protein
VRVQKVGCNRLAVHTRDLHWATAE